MQQLYRELLTIADQNGGRLQNRVFFFLDELGSLPPIEGLELLYSAGRSRGLVCVGLIQSKAQLEKNYGKEGAAIILDNCQVEIFGGFSPSSQTAKELSQALGNQTVLTGSITKNPKDGSKSLQMLARPLATEDELKVLPRFHYVILKTGCRPIKTYLPLYFNWQIKFGEKYSLPAFSPKIIEYATKDRVSKAIIKKFPQQNSQNSKLKSLYEHRTIE